MPTPCSSCQHHRGQHPAAIVLRDGGWREQKATPAPPSPPWVGASVATRRSNKATRRRRRRFRASLWSPRRGRARRSPAAAAHHSAPSRGASPAARIGGSAQQARHQLFQAAFGVAGCPGQGAPHAAPGRCSMMLPAVPGALCRLTPALRDTHTSLLLFSSFPFSSFILFSLSLFFPFSIFPPFIFFSSPLAALQALVTTRLHALKTPLLTMPTHPQTPRAAPQPRRLACFPRAAPRLPSRRRGHAGAAARR